MRVPTKYGARPTTVDNIRFASQKEAGRYSELKLMQRAGLIVDLKLQPRFPLKVNDELVCTYVADFSYLPVVNGEIIDALIVEDVKGLRTPMYRLKAKMFAAQYGFPVTEV